MNQQQPNLSGGYRSRYLARYLAYVNQQPAPPARKPPTQWSRLSRVLLSVAIFIGLFLAILTLFGFWLSRAERSAALTEVQAAPPVAQAIATPSPTPAAGKRRNTRGQ